MSKTRRRHKYYGQDHFHKRKQYRRRKQEKELEKIEKTFLENFKEKPSLQS